MSIVNQLPDAYRKDANGNNYKLLSIWDSSNENLLANIEAAYDAAGIDTAVGAALDAIGERLDQPRGGLHDSAYRLILKAKIGCDQCDGTYDGVLTCIAAVFAGGDLTSVSMSEDDGIARITSIPLTAIVASGMDGEQAIALIRELMPIGTSVICNVEGTFAFASGTSIETDSDAGLSNAEQTTGGYFGMIMTGMNTNSLPI